MSDDFGLSKAPSHVDAVPDKYSLKVFPNPATTGLSFVLFEASSSLDVNIGIVDVSGKYMQRIYVGSCSAGRHIYPVE